MEKGKSVQASFKALVEMSRYGQDPQKKALAHKLVRIINLTRNNQNYLNALSASVSAEGRAGVTGLVIDNRGRILPGEFAKSTQRSSGIPDLLLAAKGQVKADYYAKISGCVGCF